MIASTLLLVLNSCSYNVFYNNLDYLIPAYINNLVELDSDQEAVVDLKTIYLLKWHQREQIPAYIEWLKNIKLLFKRSNAAELNSEVISNTIDQSTIFWHVLRQKLYLELAAMLPQLSAQQSYELFENLSEDNEQFIEKNISLTAIETKNRHKDRLISSFEKWLGYLTDEQVTLLEQSASGFQSLSRQRLAARLEWQQKTRKIIESDNSIKKTNKLKELFQKLSEKNDLQYHKINLNNKKLLASLIIRVENLMQDKQKQHLSDNLDYYIEMLSEFEKYKWK